MCSHPRHFPWATTQALGRTSCGALRVCAVCPRRNACRLCQLAPGERWDARQSGDAVARIARAWLHPKKKTLIAQERDEEARDAWRAEIAGVAPDRLVFLDETGVSTTLVPTYARAPKGTRAYGPVPQARHHSSTLLATLTIAGMGQCVVFKGALDRVVFDAFVDQFLVPALRPGQIVILDNLSVHKSAHAQQAIANANCELRFLPTYSPDLNPIELANSLYKHRMRRARPRSHEEVITASNAALADITPAKARAFFRHAGYGQGEPDRQPL